MANQEHRTQAAILMMQAMQAAQFGDYQETVRLLTESLQKYPDNGEAYHNRGMAYSKMQRWQEALSDFNHAIALEPHPSSYEQRGLIYYHLGDRHSAYQDWQETLRMDPGRTFPLINLGWLCIEEKRYQEAIDHCTQAIDVEPTLAAAYKNRAQAYLELGDKAQAFADIQKAKYLVESGLDSSDQDLVE